MVCHNRTKAGKASSRWLAVQYASLEAAACASQPARSAGSWGIPRPIPPQSDPISGSRQLPRAAQKRMALRSRPDRSAFSTAAPAPSIGPRPSIQSYPCATSGHKAVGTIARIVCGSFGAHLRQNRMSWTSSKQRPTGVREPDVRAALVQHQPAFGDIALDGPRSQASPLSICSMVLMICCRS